MSAVLPASNELLHQQPLDHPLWHRVADLHPRLRAHVRVQRRVARGERWFLLIDPDSGQFHRVTASAWALVGRLDGRHNLDTLWHQVHGELGEAAPTQSEVLQMLAQLRDADLLAMDTLPDVQALQRTRTQQQRQRVLASVNPLSFKVPLLNPSRMLDVLMPLARALFSAWGLLAWAAWTLWALVLAVGDADALAHAVRTQGNSSALLWSMWLAYPVVKAVHEFAHALAVRVWGGEVREMGINLMMLTPVPYVDASAATGFAQRRRRMGVDAAGILAELAIGAAAFQVWHAASQPEVQQVALAVMLLCTVSTVLFNANPLMRFDGYHLLSDALDVPNLHTRTREAWAGVALRALGLPTHTEGAQATASGRVALLGYGAAAMVYRWAVGFGLVLWLHESHPWLALGVLLLLGAGMVVKPLGQALRFLVLDTRLSGRRAGVWVRSAAAAGVLVAAVMALPAPLVSLQQGVVWLPEQALLRVPTGGQIDTLHAARGDTVVPGQVIATLSNLALQEEQLQAAARRTKLDVELFQALLSDPAKAQRLSSERAAIDAQLARLLERQQALTVRALAGGTLSLPREADDTGRHYAQGSVLGQVIDATQPPLVKVALTEAQAARLRDSGLQRAEVRLAMDPQTTLVGHVERTTPQATQQLPSAVLGSAQGGPIATDPQDPQGERTLQPVTVIDVRLDASADTARLSQVLGMRAWVRLDHGSEPLLTQGLRALRQLFLRSLGAQA